MDWAEEGRRSDRRHSANLLWERVESCVTLVVGVVVCVSRGRGVESSIIGCKAICDLAKLGNTPREGV